MNYGMGAKKVFQMMDDLALDILAGDFIGAQMSAQMNNRWGVNFGDYMGIERADEVDWRRILRIPTEKREEREYFFLPDTEYPAMMHMGPDAEERFNQFKRVVRAFKQLGGNVVYARAMPTVANPTGTESGTIFIDDNIPEEFKDKAADLFEGLNYRTRKLTILRADQIP